MNKDVYIRSFTYIVHVIIFHEAEVGHLVKFISQTWRDIFIAILRKFECFFLSKMRVMWCVSAADAEKWTYCSIQGGFDFIASPVNSDKVCLLLSGELLAERCRTDDLMPSIPVFCLPPSRVDPKVLELNVLIYHSQPGGSWTTNRSPPIRWWSQRGGDDTVVVLLWSWSSQVPEKPQSERLDLFRDWQAARDAPDCVICSVPGVRNR